MKKIIFALYFLYILANGVFSEQFSFQYSEGDKYRILSTVKEDVYIDNEYSHTAQILNKIALEIEDVKDGSGKISAEFVTSERSAGKSSVYRWAENYKSVFWRDSAGRYDIESRYFMPVVRDVPVFPSRDLQPGDTWSAEGWEVHDFRQNFNLPDPYRFPVKVYYTYEGKARKDGKEYDLISIEYTVFFRAPEKYRQVQLYPMRITGYSSQKLYWDSGLGRPYAYNEEFDFIFTLSSGLPVEYKGTAEAKVIPSEKMNRSKLAEGIKKRLSGKGYKDTDVRVDEKGVTISLENIQFMPDSANLMPSEKSKLMTIAEILRENPGRDILITGHTALAGTEEGRNKLSEERARAVADFLLSTKVRSEEEMVIRGLGATQPIADNNTEAGRRKNRRVEITILEN